MFIGCFSIYKFFVCMSIKHGLLARSIMCMYIFCMLITTNSEIKLLMELLQNINNTLQRLFFFCFFFQKNSDWIATLLISFNGSIQSLCFVNGWKFKMSITLIYKFNKGLSKNQFNTTELFQPKLYMNDH